MNGQRRFRFVITVVAVMVLAAAIAAPGFAQTGEQSSILGVTVLGMLIGVYSVSYEHALDDNLSIFVIPTYINPRRG